MPNYYLTHFGNVDLDAIEEYYDTEITIDNKKIDIDLNFEHQSISEDKIEKVQHFINNIPGYHKNALVAIRNDYNNEGDAKEYIETHMDALSTENIQLLIADVNKDISTEEKLLSTLYLKRVGLYIETDFELAVFDYTISNTLTNYLIVVNFKSDGTIDYITIES